MHVSIWFFGTANDVSPYSCEGMRAVLNSIFQFHYGCLFDAPKDNDGDDEDDYEEDDDDDDNGCYIACKAKRNTSAGE